MKMRHSVKWMLVGVLALPGLTACSTGGDEEADEIESTDEGNAANADNAEGESGDGNALAAENTAGAETAGAEAAPADIPPELLNSENGGTPPVGTEVAQVGGGEAPAAEGGAAAAAEAAPAGGAAPAAASASVPTGDMRVYYVSVDSAALHSGPQAGASVGNLAKGDPVLVKIEGSWANVINRGYVEVANLSPSPVGRKVSSKSWQ